LADFEKRGIRIAAISADPPEATREHITKMGWTYTFLSDAKAEVIRRYDLLHPDAGPGGDISRPAELLIDPAGTVRWIDLTESYWVRTRPETVLREFDRLAG
jgi:peroxiredoxin